MARAAGSTFPLRFDNEQTRQAVRSIAEQCGVSMNKLIQDALAVQLGLTSMVLEARLEKTVEALRSYRASWSDADIVDYAAAEMLDDPLQARMVEADESDPLGVMQAFEHG
jgi:hypothetical protein